ncbi:MAG: DUF1028 domain-containing protein [Chloroflexia bacterium]|nr:DUF1028 domain-containing protein [Chloroflexia bacterium]
MTLSIAGRCVHTGQFGIAISSSSPAVAARCAWARAGVGAVCTQNITDPRLGPLLLDRMAAGESALAAMRAVTGSEPAIAWRQITAIDRDGVTATWSGAETLGTYATAEGPDCVAAGNLLADSHVPLEMVGAFAARPDDDLGTRLTAALAAGLAAGGEAGPVHSAGLLIVSDVPWPLTDLRVDWAKDPIAELAALWRLWRPQADAYRTRALDPSAAPSYGVPGDEGDGVMG